MSTIWEKIDINHETAIFLSGASENKKDEIAREITSKNKVHQIFLDEKNAFGFFAISETENIALCDHTQSYPVYYNTITGDVSCKADDLITGTINKQSVIEFSTAGYTLGSETLYSDIKQVQAGEYIQIDKTVSPPKITKERYYIYSPKPAESKKTESELINELGLVIDRVFERMMKSINGQPICVPLSGGLDSRLILAKLCEYGVKNIHTFSYGLKNNFEAKTAKKVAHMLSVDWFMVAANPRKAEALYHSEMRKKYTNETHGFSRIPSYVEFEALQNIARQNSIPQNSVIINGQSGDYISGGHIPQCLYEKDDPSEEDMYRYIFDKHFSLWKNLKTPEIEEKIKEHIQDLLLPYSEDLSKKDNFIRQYESFEWQERQCKMVVNGQKAYDFFGYDWRLPLWDKELMDFFESLPWEYKYKQKLFKSYLKKWNYKGVFDFMSAEPEMWSAEQFWIKWMARAIGIVKSREEKSDFYKKMSYYSDSHWQYALFGKEIYNKHYKNIRNMISLAVLKHLEDIDIDFPGDM